VEGRHWSRFIILRFPGSLFVLYLPPNNFFVEIVFC
jgi:hypothetical protein